MDRKNLLLIGGLALLTLVIALLAPGGREPDSDPKLPWRITVHPDGTSTVFGITLGKTSLEEAQRIFQAEGETSLFVSPGEDFSVESYFKNLYLSGLKGDFVLSLGLDKETLKGMYGRGLRISKLESGARRVTLADGDMKRVAKAPVDHITYLPGMDLTPELIESRFGKPARRVREEDGVEHWLYPDKGLDIAYNPNGKEVFQYVPPARFDRLTAPLEESAARG